LQHTCTYSMYMGVICVLCTLTSFARLSADILKWILMNLYWICILLSQIAVVLLQGTLFEA